MSKFNVEIESLTEGYSFGCIPPSDDARAYRKRERERAEREQAKIARKEAIQHAAFIVGLVVIIAGGVAWFAYTFAHATFAYTYGR